MESQVTLAKDGLSVIYYGFVSLVIALLVKVVVNAYGRLDGRNAEENATSPSIESPKSEDLKVPEAVTNGDAPADDTAKPTDTPTTVEEPEKPVEEPKAEEPKAAEIEEPKVPEPIVEKSVESAPSPAKEQEEPKSVEPPTPVEETKEVRSEEIPPPLPSSNPPSPVTVFAESTKADSLTADQVPINLPQSVPVVETIPEPSVVQSVLESQPLAASSPVINTVCENPAVLETKIESVSQQNDEKSSLETVSVPEPLQKDNTETFRNDQASEQISDSSKTEISKTPECATDPSAPIEVSPDAPKSSEVDLIPSQETETSPKPDKIPEEVTKSEVIENLPENATESKQETVISPESVKTVSESQKENEPEPVSEPTETNQLVTEKNESTLHVEAAEITKEEKLPDVSMQATTIEEVSKETLEAPESLTESPGVSVNIGGAQLATENSEKPEEETIEDAVKSIKSSDVSNEVIETSEVLLDPSKPKETVVVEEKPEILQETPKDFKETVTESAEQSSDLPEESAKLPEPSQSPETCLTEPPVEPSLPSPLSSTDVVQESSTPVPENIPGPVVTSPESQSPTIEQLPESVVNPADSLPDISTESLPSLPEPLSENLAEPMSLPPVDSVPEPIATDCPVSEISHPSDSTVLTNGNANGLPSPTDEVSALPLKEGPLKQVPTETSNEVRQEEGDQKIIAVDAPAVEE
ncbi:uncharacterized protein isoform X2 [Leptinotarsa decemlineata]|uniref:uncharacterized protein isoform X2 n=1 Tax=Leptinotarsa decemlineata TaxID=7539 RepID=UPI003D30424A